MVEFLAPADLSRALVGVGEKKAALPAAKMFVLGVLAGAFIGFAAHLATTVATGHAAYWGFQKFLVGAVFSVGLMLVIIPGSELWTGNNLMTVSLMARRISAGGLLRNWLFVYAGNLVGSVLLAWMIASGSGLLDGAVGGTAIDMAYAKVTAAPAALSHNAQYFFRAVGCNVLVCLAVMMAAAAQDIAGKVLAIFFPIMAFVTSGFEHSIANMYFIPAGVLARGSKAAVEACSVDPAGLEALNWGSMWSQNIVSVTLGNLVGGGMVGVVYWWLFVRGGDAHGVGEQADQSQAGA